jgi:outer membrane protein assembly factor BamE (lipoprotein component of BamABCDE complex)
MRRVFNNIVLITISGLFLIGCIGNQNQSINGNIDNKDMLTLGMVQTIKVGNTKSEIVTLMGSPNIISSENNKEIWIYDKISSENIQTSGKVTAAGVAPIGVGAGFLGVSGEQKNNTISSKTLTVIIIFNSLNQVEKLTYHSSKY